MTIPWMMNCEHGDEGWCLGCVVKMGNEREALRKLLETAVDLFEMEPDCSEIGSDAWVWLHQAQMALSPDGDAGSVPGEWQAGSTPDKAATFAVKVKTSEIPRKQPKVIIE